MWADWGDIPCYLSPQQWKWEDGNSNSLTVALCLLLTLLSAGFWDKFSSMEHFMSFLRSSSCQVLWQGTSCSDLKYSIVPPPAGPTLSGTLCPTVSLWRGTRPATGAPLTRNSRTLLVSDSTSFPDQHLSAKPVFSGETSAGLFYFSVLTHLRTVSPILFLNSLTQQYPRRTTRKESVEPLCLYDMAFLNSLELTPSQDWPCRQEKKQKKVG